MSKPKHKIAPSLETSPSSDVYVRIYLEPHLRRAFDAAYANGMEHLLGEMLSYAWRMRADGYPDGAAAMRFLRLFEPEVTRIGRKHDLDEKPTARRYRMNMHARPVYPVFVK